MKTTSLKTKLTTLRNFRTTYLATLFAVALATTFLAASHSQAQLTQAIQHGDILVPVGQSTIEVYDPNTYLSKGTIGPHPTFSVATGDVMVRTDHEPLLALFDANDVGWWTSMGMPKPTFGNVTYNAQPNSFACHANPYVYVGQEGGTGDVLKFDQLGNLIATYDVPTVARGSVWIDVADPVLWYVTGPGSIKRYNMTTGGVPPMADYGVGLINNPEEFKIIPSGPFAGQVIVADPPNLKRLSGADGTIPGPVYFTPGDQVFPTAVTLDPDGIHVWTADRVTGNVILYNIEVGGIAVDSFPTNQFGEVSGLAIDGERTVCRGTTPPPPLSGRMTGGGTFPIASGGLASHGFTLGSPSDPPNRMTVVWKDSNGNNNNKFKLTLLTSAVLVNDPTFSPNPPRAGFDTYTGTGNGTLNGMAGATATWTFTDKGEPGTNDTVDMTIKNASGTTVMTTTVPVPLTGGNHQAHP